MLDCRGKQLAVGKRCFSSRRSGRSRGVGWGDRWRRRGSSAPHTDGGRLTAIAPLCRSNIFIIHDPPVTGYYFSLPWKTCCVVQT